MSVVIAESFIKWKIENGLLSVTPEEGYTAEDGYTLYYNAVSEYAEDWIQYTQPLAAFNGTYYFKAVNQKTYGEEYADIIGYVNCSAENGGAINNSGTLELENAYFLSNSATSNGGAVYNTGSMTLNSAVFSENSGENYGGAICNSFGGTMTIGSATFIGNSAAEGGAIEHYGSMTLSNAVFINNSAKSHGGAIFNAGGSMTIDEAVFNNNSAASGGAVYDYGKGSLTLSSGTFSGNSASNGGAIFVNRYMTISSGVFEKNTANTGGAIYNNLNGILRLSSASFINNIANANGNGGALANEGTVALSSADFSANSAMGGGAIHNGGNMTLSTAEFRGNSAGYYGGAITNWGYGSMGLSSAAFSSNYASFGGGAICNGPAGGGDVSMTIDRASFIENSAKEAGGAIENAGSMTLGSAAFNKNSAVSGGAVYNGGSASMTLSSGTFTENTASYGGAIYNAGWYEEEDRTYGKITLSNVSFSRNSATNGGAIFNRCNSSLVNEYNSQTYNLGSGIITLSNATFTGNSATNGGAVYNEGTTYLTNARFETTSDTIYNTGAMTFAGVISLAGNLYTANMITATGADMVFDISSYTGGNTTEIISDISKISGADSWSITVNADQATGIYKLAANAATFTGSMSIKSDDSTLIESLTIDGEEKISGNKKYSLIHDSSYLLLSVSDMKKTVDLDWIWDINADGKLEISTEDGYTVYYAENPGNWTVYTEALSPIQGVYYFKAENAENIAKTEITGFSGQTENVITNSGTQTLNNTYFVNNSFTPNGIICNTVSAGMILENFVFNNNRANIINNGTMSISGATFSGNSAGAATLSNTGRMMTLSDVSFSGNSAYDGGAINNNNYKYATMTLSDVSFSGNSAYDGGAIYNSNYATMTLSDVSFTGNSANSSGGAIYNMGSMTLSDVSFTGNSANSSGDAIYNTGSMTFTGTISLGGNLSTTETITATGADMVFDISSYTEGNTTEIISDISLISGADTWSVTVKSTQATGLYKLASGASSFNKTITVKNTDGTILAESLTVNGEAVRSGSREYQLVRSNSDLVLNITKDSGIVDWSWKVNDDGLLELSVEDGYDLYYKTTSGSWETYTGPLELINGGYSLKAVNRTSASDFMEMSILGRNGFNYGGSGFENGYFVNLPAPSVFAYNFVASGSVSQAYFSGNSNALRVMNGIQATLNNATFLDNGVAIYNYGGSATLNNAVISGNSAVTSGNMSATVMNINGSMFISDTKILNNSGYRAGAIFNTNGGRLTLSNVVFSGNSVLNGNSAYSSPYGCGAIMNNGGYVTLTDIETKTKSDGIYNQYGNMTLSGNITLAGGIYGGSINAGNADILLDISSWTEVSSIVSGGIAAKSWTVKVSDDQVLGEYGLYIASDSITLKGERGQVYGDLATTGNYIGIDNTKYSFNQSSGKKLVVEDYSSNPFNFIVDSTNMKLSVSNADYYTSSDQFETWEAVSSSIPLYNGVRYFKRVEGSNTYYNTLYGYYNNSTGAINNISGAQSITYAYFVRNSAVTGGGIYNRNEVFLYSADFQSNTAAFGGAIYNTGSMTLEHATFSGNSATLGGAIYNTGSMTLASASFSGNSATSYGGAIYNTGSMTLEHATFSGNRASSGGAIYNAGGTIYMKNIKATDCITDSIYTDSGTLIFAGLNTIGTLTAVNNATIGFDISEATYVYPIINHLESAAANYMITVNADQAAGTYILASNAASFTGSMSVTCEDITIVSSLMADGDVKTTWNKVYSLSHNGTDLILTISDKAQPPTVDLDWTWNINAEGKLEVSTEEGYMVSYATVETPPKWTEYTSALDPFTGTYYFRAENSSGLANNAITGYVSGSAVNGGAVYNSDTKTLENAYFIGNTATSSGGAINNSSYMTLGSAVFNGNSAMYGGAIYNNTGSMTLEHATFSGNSASSGGAIYNNATITFTGDLVLSTATDTIVNSGTLNWNVTGGTSSHAKLTGYDKLTNSGTLSITVSANQGTGDYTIASGVTDTTDKNIFKLTGGTGNDVTITVGGEAVQYSGRTYSLAVTDQTLMLNVASFIDYDLSESVDTKYDGNAHSISVTVNDSAENVKYYYSLDNGTSWNEGNTYSLTDVGNGDVCFKITADGYQDTVTDSRSITIGKRQVTLTSADDTKVYDGTALTNSTITVTGDGFAGTESYTADVTGKQTDAGSSKNTFTYELTNGAKTGNYEITKVEGTLSITKNTQVITITAASASQKYNGEALTNSGYTFTQGVLASGHTLTATVSGTITDAGTAENVVTEYHVIRDSDSKDVTAYYTFADSVKGTLTVTQRDVTLTSNSDSQKYDGTALEGTVTVGGDGFVDGEATASASSLTDAGSITNTITVNEGSGYKASNYNITKTEGTLEVTKRQVTLTSADDTKVYDGTALTNSTITVTGDGFAGTESYTADVTGKQTDAGSSKNTFTYELTNGAKAGNYEITKVEGTLEVTKVITPITITAKSGTQTYNGTAYSLNDYTYTGTLAEGDELVVTVTGSITDAGTVDNVVSSYKVMRGTEDVTGNYTFNDSVKGTLTVTQRNVTLTSNSDSQKYDGTALEGTVTVGGDGFVDGEATVSASSLTDAGSITNTITVNEGSGYKASNYNITKTEGTLEVTKRQVTLTSADDTKVYDGTALTNSTITVTGDGFAGTESYTADVTGKQTDAGSSKNTFTYELTNGAKTGNYEITKVEGTLTVLPKETKAPVVSEVKTTGYITEINWGTTEGRELVDVAFSSKDSPEEKLIVQTNQKSINIYANPEAYDLNLKYADGTEWSDTTELAAKPTSGSTSIESNANGITDLFFVNVSGTWGSKHQAQHQGSVNDWSGTGERTGLKGKNKIADIYTGADINILVLTDDVNGDALFVDDIFTTFPTEQQQSRIAKINEVFAGAGNDIVDMTSQRFEYQGNGVTVHGGSGNDIIWANKGNNILFGDAGNDRIIGASGNDTVIGGAGNDSMHGGGGNDVFTFCENWGTDTVEQLSGGSVTLWFASGSKDNWDASTLTYTDGSNRVQVTGVANDKITLKFGDDGSEQYDKLSEMSAFKDYSSQKIFEDTKNSLLS